jgi:predicted negative regulator of RcsB-dependent stress response
VDEYLSEKEQLERIRHWWSDYGWYLMGGVAIGLLGLFGYRQYNASMNSAAEAAAALYVELEAAVEDDDRAAAEQVVTALQNDYSDSPYADNASLMLARMVLVSDPDRAIEALRGVMENSRDAELAMIARLRLARVLAWQEMYDEALALLDIDDAGAFAARMADIRGDILVARGETDAARAAYTSALVLPGSDGLDRSYLQIKLNNLQTARPAASTDAAEVLPEVDLESIDSQVSEDPAEPTAESESAAAQGESEPAEDSGGP